MATPTARDREPIRNIVGPSDDVCWFDRSTLPHEQCISTLLLLCEQRINDGRACSLMALPPSDGIGNNYTIRLFFFLYARMTTRSSVILDYDISKRPS